MLVLTTDNPISLFIEGVCIATISAEPHARKMRYYVDAPKTVRVERQDRKEVNHVQPRTR